MLQICARYAKNDKALMARLRELKFKYHEGMPSQTQATLQTNPNALTGATCPDEMVGENQSQVALGVLQENQQLKKDLDFLTAEVDRLRAKLVVEDKEEMPALSAELFGINSKDRERGGASGSFKLNDSMDN